MFVHHLVELTATFVQVVLIDLALAGDNAVVIGMAAAGLEGAQRKKAIVAGIAAATVLRIAFATAASFLLAIVGLLLAGGLLLLWVCWKMWRELRETEKASPALQTELGSCPADGGPPPTDSPRKTLGQAITQIVIADVSMSLDNVLAVAGAAHEHPLVLALGLSLSVVLMGFAAALVARLLDRHRWIAYIGLAIILFVAFEMIYRGAVDTSPLFTTLAAHVAL